MDFYNLLGVQINATEEEIKKAYRKKAMDNHPDRNPGDKDAEKRFKEIQQAYENLVDPNKRARYNAQKPPPPQRSTTKVQPRRKEFTFYDAAPPTVDLWGRPLSAKEREEWARDNREDIIKVQNSKKFNTQPGFVDVFRYESQGSPNIR